MSEPTESDQMDHPQESPPDTPSLKFTPSMSRFSLLSDILMDTSLQTRARKELVWQGSDAGGPRPSMAGEHTTDMLLRIDMVLNEEMRVVTVATDMVEQAMMEGSKQTFRLLQLMNGLFDAESAYVESMSILQNVFRSSNPSEDDSTGDPAGGSSSGREKPLGESSIDIGREVEPSETLVLLNALSTLPYILETAHKVASKQLKSSIQDAQALLTSTDEIITKSIKHLSSSTTAIERERDLVLKSRDTLRGVQDPFSARALQVRSRVSLNDCRSRVKRLTAALIRSAQEVEGRRLALMTKAVTQLVEKAEHSSSWLCSEMKRIAKGVEGSIQQLQSIEEVGSPIPSLVGFAEELFEDEDDSEMRQNVHELFASPSIMVQGSLKMIVTPYSARPPATREWRPPATHEWRPVWCVLTKARYLHFFPPKWAMAIDRQASLSMASPQASIDGSAESGNSARQRAGDLYFSTLDLSTCAFDSSLEASTECLTLIQSTRDGASLLAKVEKRAISLQMENLDQMLEWSSCIREVFMARDLK